MSKKDDITLDLLQPQEINLEDDIVIVEEETLRSNEMIEMENDFKSLSDKFQQIEDCCNKILEDYKNIEEEILPSLCVSEVDVRTIHISGLEYYTSDRELRDFFSECGIIINASNVTNRQGRSLGYGLVEFADRVSVDLALKKSGRVLNGRVIKIKKRRTNKRLKSRRVVHQQPQKTYYPSSSGSYLRVKTRGDKENSPKSHFHIPSPSGRIKGNGNGGRGMKPRENSPKSLYHVPSPSRRIKGSENGRGSPKTIFTPSPNSPQRITTLGRTKDVQSIKRGVHSPSGYRSPSRRIENDPSRGGYSQVGYNVQGGFHSREKRVRFEPPPSSAQMRGRMRGKHSPESPRPSNIIRDYDRNRYGRDRPSYPPPPPNPYHHHHPRGRGRGRGVYYEGRGRGRGRGVYYEGRGRGGYYEGHRGY